MTTTQWVGPADDPDRYQLTEMRSRGGEGELWVGWITVDEQQLPVAVKVYEPSANLPLPEMATRVRGQAEILRSLQHPNLVKVREAFTGPEPHEQGAADESTEVLYLIMNWVVGDNLEGWVARYPERDLLECTRIVSRLADAVDELHGGRSTQGVAVLHRDIKPANVIVQEQDVCLVDFGLARFATGEHPTVAGTPGYLAPEVLAGAQPSEASDRFGVGAVAFFLFTGVAPNLADVAEMRSHLQQVDEIVDKDGFTNHVMAMLDPDPARRPANTIEWAQGLAVGAVTQSFQHPMAGGRPGFGQGPAPEAKPRRGRRFALAGALVLVAAIAGAGAVFALTRDGGGDSEDPDDAAAVSDEATTTIESTTTSTSTSSTTTSTTSTTEPDELADGEVDDPEASLPSGPIQYLADLTAVDSNFDDMLTGRGDLSGETYTRAVMFRGSYSDPAYVEYNLSRRFSRLEGQLGLRDDVPSQTTMKLEIYADGEKVLDETVKLGGVVPFDLDVDNVLRLRLQVTDLTEDVRSWEQGYAIFADPRLIR